MILMSDTPEVGEQTPEVSQPEVIAPDATLLASQEVARNALLEITTLDTIGEFVGHEVHEPHVLTLFFACKHPAYPAWRWAATLARVDATSPVNVLEVELLPGEGALLAPEWVPWSVRLAQYRELQAVQAAEEERAALAAAAELVEEDDVDPEDDVLENDFSDFDDEIDGVNVDGEDSDDLGELLLSVADDLDDDDDIDDEEIDEDDDDDVEIDEDGFADIDEHDLNEIDDDDLDIDELSLER